MTNWATRRHNKAAPGYDFRGGSTDTATESVYFTCVCCGKCIKTTEIIHIDSILSSDHRNHLLFHVECFEQIAGKEYIPNVKENYHCFHCDRSVPAGEKQIQICYRDNVGTIFYVVFHDNCFMEAAGKDFWSKFTIK